MNENIAEMFPFDIEDQLSWLALADFLEEWGLQKDSKTIRHLGMRFARIPAGTFLMGSPADESGLTIGEIPHWVTLSRGFHLGIYPVTQAQYRLVMGSNPSASKGDKLPVNKVSWGDCQAFCKRLSGLTGKTFRLPSEAEWEYACRAGTKTAFCFGDEVALLNQYAWYGNNSGDTTHPVGEKLPNAWGLYDMHGNVREWCQDWYSYPFDEDGQSLDLDVVAWVRDPVGPEEGEERRIRGGSWFDCSDGCRSACRHRSRPDHCYSTTGFRVAVDLP